MQTSYVTRLRDAWNHYVARPVFVLTVLPVFLLYHRLDEMGLQYRARARLRRFRCLLQNPRALEEQLRKAWRR